MGVLEASFTYSGFNNMELRLRAAMNLGGKHTEVGENQIESRIELRVRYHF